jgi:hypothetical protein
MVCGIGVCSACVVKLLFPFCMCRCVAWPRVRRIGVGEREAAIDEVIAWHGYVVTLPMDEVIATPMWVGWVGAVKLVLLSYPHDHLLE